MVILCGMLRRQGLLRTPLICMRKCMCIYIAYQCQWNLHFKWIGSLGMFFSALDLKGIFQLQCQAINNGFFPRG